MILFLEILLLITCLIIINSFVFYPVVVNLLGSNKINTPVKNIYEPTVAIIIAAYNEEKVIAQRIQNIASQDYDLSKIQVYVGSDASSDRTNEILTELKKEYSWLNLLLSEKRMGKAGILNELIQHIDSEIIVFTDANTDFQKDAVKNLVNGFTSEEVGGVCGRLVLTDSDSTRSDGVEESKYWRYETFIKNAEGKLGVSLAANGGIFAIRRSLYRNIPTEKAVTDDLFISLSIVAQGYKFNYKEDAVAYENTGNDLQSEYNRKVRFSATNFQLLADFKQLLFSKNRLLAYAFFSHKVTRWGLPFLLSLTLILSYSLALYSFAAALFFSLQILFYFLAAVGFVFSKLKIQMSVFSLPYFFVVSNIAVAAGYIKFRKKKHSVIWTSTER
ncbi:MAG: hypothetical protein A2499_15250 [Stygiobacter sp. RIFOXYC12_FULL_38_8]|nr:MAG: hypothetical protein A2X62_10785 [Stygiobacter sp. GWC2_38_9]OGV09102.1 MAG: hypothetical protein A2299_11795 [Stygiobacter sp. RIFOXYB2_FULL_37_11]OGV16328.1 MAG: hypothetical protein A2440_04700 [Stygiobacter sp. RIFOXYC2_FULL_38_25]OGV17474.1 MAG: hypothetical protein A2237_07440 [Stygiobacter sp. RIFOXYA2_FULL_38_8]OGV24387.1 MAG: hypothetical protein A2499_15250 [Stygiobacter sp. RIFOXYC12_FULL_38_8]OGV81580.1 MAG: hypothetical protein A2X65_15135 [Stygiobacter sp. GWF2_38_21]RJQ